MQNKLKNKNQINKCKQIQTNVNKCKYMQNINKNKCKTPQTHTNELIQHETMQTHAK